MTPSCEQCHAAVARIPSYFKSSLPDCAAQLTVIPNGTVIIGNDGKIAAVGREEEIALQAEFSQASFEHDVDAAGKVVLPGFVDAHTHPIFAGDRAFEFRMKIEGCNYMQIHESGGGIGFTVKHTQAASDNELLELLLSRCDRLV